MNFIKRAIKAVDDFIFGTDRLLIQLVQKLAREVARTGRIASRLFRWIIAELRAIGKDLDDLVYLLYTEAVLTVRECRQFIRELNTYIMTA